MSPSGKQIYPLAAAGAAEPTGENFRKIEMPIKYLDMNLGTLIVVLDMTPAVDKLRQQNDELTMLLFSMLAVMFLTIVLELELAVKRPLRALNDAARKLAAADYDASLPGAGRDEVGTLVGSFAFMRDELHRQQLALVEEHRKLLEQIAERKRAENEVNALNRQLEQRVAQRTMQLEASNKELELFPIPCRMICVRRCARSMASPISCWKITLPRWTRRTSGCSMLCGKTPNG